MSLHIDITYRSGATVRTGESFERLRDAVAYALGLADELGRTFSTPAYGPAAAVRVLRGEDLELEVRIFMGGLAGSRYTGPSLVDL